VTGWRKERPKAGSPTAAYHERRPDILPKKFKLSSQQSAFI
jgi:hypothetical protein